MEDEVSNKTIRGAITVVTNLIMTQQIQAKNIECVNEMKRLVAHREQREFVDEVPRID